MKFIPTTLQGAYVVELEKHSDERGFFTRMWCEKEFADKGLASRMVQENMSGNHKKGTIRGFHYQIAPHEEAKLVRCVKGAVFDVIIDLRPKSETYKQWIGIELNEEQKNMLYVPEGFAHAYQVLEDNTEVCYLVSQFYSPGSEKGIRWNDPLFKVIWPIQENLLISDKDQAWPNYSD
jgi:dTDP-4-dehydrorhamnose 3,5-epimerase